MGNPKVTLVSIGVIIVIFVALVLALEFPFESDEWNCYSADNGATCKCDPSSTGGNGSCIETNLSGDPVFWTAGFDSTNVTPTHCRAWTLCSPLGYKQCAGDDVCIAKEGYVKCDTVWDSC